MEKYNMKKKILFITPSCNAGGGTIASLLSIVNSNLNKDYDFHVFSIYGGIDFKCELMKFNIGCNTLTRFVFGNYSELSSYLKLFALPFKIFRALKKFRPLLESWVINWTVKTIRHKYSFDWVVGFQEGFATEFASRFMSEKKIAWIHCDYAYAFSIERDECSLYDKFTKVVCVSNYTMSTFVERYPSLKSKVVAIHNIFDAKNILSKADVPIDDYRFHSDYYTIITVGRISKVKQLYQLPSIASYLKNCGMKFRWYIIGGGDEGGEKERLDAEIAKYDIEDCFILLGKKRNPYPYFKAADLLLTNSSSEACPMIFNEAKLLGLPILSNTFGSAYEFILEEEGDMIVPTLQMGKCLKKLIAKGKKQKTPRFVIDTAANQIKELFES